MNDKQPNIIMMLGYQWLYFFVNLLAILACKIVIISSRKLWKLKSIKYECNYAHKNLKYAKKKVNITFYLSHNSKYILLLYLN